MFGDVSIAKGTYTIVVASKDGSKYTAEYAVFAGNSFTSGSDDIVYVDDDPVIQNKDGYETVLNFVDGSGNIETVTTKKAAAKSVFYSYEINDDDVYELTALKEDDASDDTYSLKNLVKNGKYDSETGFVLNAVVDGLNRNALSCYTDGVTADDVDLADNVIILDQRTSTERDNSGYKNKITSASQLEKAIDKDGWNVIANVYFDDEEVLLIAVVKMVETDEKVAADNAKAVTSAVNAIQGLDEELVLAAQETPMTADEAVKAAKAVITEAVDDETVTIEVEAVEDSYTAAVNADTETEPANGEITVSVTLTAGESEKFVEVKFVLTAMTEE